MLAAIMERAALETIWPYLDEGEHALGVVVAMTHDAPIGVGLPIRAVATVTDLDGRAIAFEIVASDRSDIVGRARHRRAVIDEAR